MESAWQSMPSFKIDTLWPDFLKTHLRGDSPMDTTLSIKVQDVPGTVVPYVIIWQVGIALYYELDSLFLKYDGTNSAHFWLQYVALFLYLVLSTWPCCVNF